LKNISSVTPLVTEENFKKTSVKNKLTFFLIFGLLFTGLSLEYTYAIDPDPVNGSSVQASATAELIEALSVTEVTQLNFGRFTSGTSGGTIVVANTATGTVNVTGTVVTVNDGSPCSALFRALGQPNAALTIALPAAGTVNLNHIGSNNTMNIASFTVSDDTPTLNAYGEAIVYVGATLTVPNTDIAKGIYSGIYNITFTYQ